MQQPNQPQTPMSHSEQPPRDTSVEKQGSGQVSGATGNPDLRDGDGPMGSPEGGTSAVIGTAGGTDAAAGAQLSGSKGGPGGPSPRAQCNAGGNPVAPDPTMQVDQVSPAAGAAVAGGTGLGSVADASDARSVGGASSGT